VLPDAVDQPSEIDVGGSASARIRYDGFIASVAIYVSEKNIRDFQIDVDVAQASTFFTPVYSPVLKITGETLSAVPQLRL